MPNEQESPSAGWRRVYEELGVSTSHEPEPLHCPACGRPSPEVADGVYRCPEHGDWRPGEPPTRWVSESESDDFESGVGETRDERSDA